MTKEEYIASGKKVLTLQIDKECFGTILSGEQKVEHRYIYPRNARQYVYYECDGEQYKDAEEVPEGDNDIKVVPVKYDALYLINGRRKDAPRMMVEVEDAEFVIMTDEKGNDLTYTQNGNEYLVSQVWYHLGNIVFTENIKE